MYRASSIFSTAATRKGDVLEIGNPSNERDTWKVKCKAMKHKYMDFKKDLAELHNKAKLADSLEENRKIHDSPRAK